MTDKYHITVIMNKENGLFYGALFENKPKPSGLDRYIMIRTTERGYTSQKLAAKKINQLFPKINQIDIDKIDETLIENIHFDKKTTITWIKPNKEDPKKDNISPIEINGHPIDENILTEKQLKRLIELKYVSFESSSGKDPNLNYLYEHYIVE